MLLLFFLVGLLSFPSHASSNKTGNCTNCFKIDFDKGIMEGTLITVLLYRTNASAGNQSYHFDFKSDCEDPSKGTNSRIIFQGNSSFQAFYQTASSKTDLFHEQNNTANLTGHKRNNDSVFRVDFYLRDNRTIELFVQGFRSGFHNAQGSEQGYDQTKCLVMPFNTSFVTTGNLTPVGYVSKPGNSVKYVKDMFPTNGIVAASIEKWPVFGIIKIALLMNVPSNKDYSPILGVREKVKGNNVFGLKMLYNTTTQSRHMVLTNFTNNVSCIDKDENDIAELEHLSIERTSKDEITVEMYYVSETVKSCTVQLENSTQLHNPLELYVDNGATIYAFKHNFPKGLISKEK